MYLKIAVLNNSGNVGKSTICQTLLKNRLTNSEVIKIESINNDGTDDEKLSAKQFELIQNKMDEYDCSIIDIGSSNIEQFMMQMEDFEGTEEDIDYFIIPVIPQHKQQIDSASTISNLLELGVSAKKIRFILNQADKSLPIEKQFSHFLNSLKMFKINIKNPPVIYQSSVFALLSEFNTTYDEVLADDRDFNPLIRAAETKDARQELSNAKAVKRIVTGFNKTLDTAFSSLNIT